MDNLNSAKLREEEASKELTHMLALQDEIIAAQSREDIGKSMNEITDFAAIERVLKERFLVGDRIQEAMANGELQSDCGTGNKLKNKSGALKTILGELSESHDCETFEITGDMDDDDTLRGRIVSRVPGYKFNSTKVRIYESRHDRVYDVIFLDDSGQEVQRYGFADFYADFMGHY